MKNHPFFHGIDWKKLANKEIEMPLKPSITHALDTSNFGEEYTNILPEDTPCIPISNHKRFFRGKTFNCLHFFSMLYATLSNSNIRSLFFVQDSPSLHPIQLNHKCQVLARAVRVHLEYAEVISCFLAAQLLLQGKMVSVDVN